MKKLMVNLATELLKDQVMNLEIKKGIMQKTYPIVLLDTDCFLYKLKQVKSLIQSQSTIILVSLSVINQLDIMKKGQEKLNISAREANRYLDQRFKYPSPFIVGQKPNQELQPPDQTIFIPESYRGIIRCALFYQKHALESNQPFAIISDNDELKGLSSYFRINGLSVGDWISSYVQKK
jgi:hypothetical protein